MALNRQDIERLIPHRPPFLWVDRILELTDTRVVAEKDVPADLDVFQGHYPHFAVLPGVLICEALFQTGAALIAHRAVADGAPAAGGDAVPVVTRLNNVQFRRMVRPGETLQLWVELQERLANAYFLRGRASVDGRVAVRLEFACASAELPAT